MRVAVLGPYPPTADGPMTGPMRVIWRLTHELAALGCHVRVFDISGRKLHGSRSARVDGPIEVWSISPYDLMSIAAGLRSHDPDIVHIHGILPPFHVPLLLQRLEGARYRTVYTIHGVTAREPISFPLRLLGPVRLQRRLLQQVNHAVALSPLSRQVALDEHLIHPQRLSVIGHGVDAEWLAAAPPALAPQRSAPDLHQLLCVGGTRWVKGTDFLLDALTALPCANWHLTIAGQRTVYETRLRQEYAPLFGTGRIYCAGHLDQAQLAGLYRAATVCIFPSRYETFGLAGLEAMAAGKPLIVSDSVGMSALIEHGRNGLIVPIGNKEQLRQALTQLLADDGLRQKMGIRALETAQQETWQCKAVEYYHLFGKLIDART